MSERPEGLVWRLPGRGRPVIDFCYGQQRFLGCVGQGMGILETALEMTWFQLWSWRISCLFCYAGCHGWVEIVMLHPKNSLWEGNSWSISLGFILKPYICVCERSASQHSLLGSKDVTYLLTVTVTMLSRWTTYTKFLVTKKKKYCKDWPFIFFFNSRGRQ